jgi:hypothetical protein
VAYSLVRQQLLPLRIPSGARGIEWLSWQMVRHLVTEGVSSPPIGSTLDMQMKRGPSQKQPRVGLQREPDMLLAQELAGVTATRSSADIRDTLNKTQSTCSEASGAIRPPTTTHYIGRPWAPATNGQDMGMDFKNSAPFRRSLSPCSP